MGKSIHNQAVHWHGMTVDVRVGIVRVVLVARDRVPCVLCKARDVLRVNDGNPIMPEVYVS